MQIERTPGHLPETSNESATTLPAYPRPQSPFGYRQILSLGCTPSIVTYSHPGHALAGHVLHQGLKGAPPWLAVS